MHKLTTETFQRPDDLSAGQSANVLYARSYLLIRTVVGAIGVLLPTLLLIVDWLFLRGDVVPRGSISAYYHSPARDLFVGALCVTGCLLMTYMAAQASTWDFWLSSTAGVAVLGVAFLPTQRPGLTPQEPRCGAEPGVPPGCTRLQDALGETLVASVHFTCAAIFILSLAAICFLFARREQEHNRRLGRARFHRACGGLILLAVAWVAVGGLLEVDIFGLTPLYLGEIVSVYAFGASWLIKGRDLLSVFRGPGSRRTSEQPA